jgi:hypothetical protein
MNKATMLVGNAASNILEMIKKTNEIKYSVFLPPKSANDAHIKGASANTNINTDTVALIVVVEQSKISSNLGSSGI